MVMYCEGVLNIDYTFSWTEKKIEWKQTRNHVLFIFGFSPVSATVEFISLVSGIEQIFRYFFLISELMKI